MEQMHLNLLLEQAIEDVKSAGVIPSDNINPEVVLNNRTSSFGLCCNRNGRFTIQISRHHLANGDEAVYRTLVHEVLHTVPGSIGHGSLWQANAKKVGDYLGFPISRLETSKTMSLPRNYKHQVSCPNCGNEFKRTRESNLTLHPESYWCGDCYSKTGKKFYLKRDF